MLALGTAAQAGYSAVLVGVAVLAPVLRDTYSLTVTETGVLLGGVSFGALASQLLWGMVVDRAGERVTIVTGLVGCAAALTAASTTHSFAGLAVLLTAAGALGASINAASGAAVIAWFPESSRGLALGIRQAGVPLGGVFAGGMLPVVTDAYGSAGGFLALAAGCAVCGVLGSVGLRRNDTRGTSGEHGLHPLADRSVLRLCSASGLLNGCQTCVIRFSVVFLHDFRALSLGAAAMVLAGMQAAAVASRIAAGRWSDHVGRRLGPFRWLALGTGATTLALAALADTYLPVVLVALVVSGLAATSWNGLSYAAVAELAGRGRVGTAIGMQQSAHAAMQAVSPLLFAVVVDRLSWGGGFALSAAAAFGAWRVLKPLAAAEEARVRASEDVAR